MVRLRHVTADRFPTLLGTLLGIYTAAMRPPPGQLAVRPYIMRDHGSRPGFVCLLAEAPQVVGFAYGFHGAPGEWWYDVVWRGLRDHAGEETCAEWLGDALEIAEIHVLPGHQGRGIGRRLLHAICAGRPERTAVLSTRDAPTAARHLYRDAGFVDLLPRFRFPGTAEPYVIAGARLPLTGAG
ncbi:GNAT family N-acetyltransferase [Thermobispora bispora]|jgi:ribosomal protein S18 acetylase RimI-like enzyme|uniref:GNAT family N-acetyltransferase n=1 Tax=Thermobispora bispora TaxID=2006 RepID=UPI0019809ED7|nr:GNAT family N-acetyltransferase [Thermobispora bispora]MBO2474154.1 GNAT family N-acetyltransferase [Actinomycetales bacterium]MBX6169696.1 GNAT family N-acetyltransferase [Thermobispora bispora]MDI9581912.1 GNAT family N-acetyltransferase [Thermobispora sp.]QSI47928.1 N-acetyltransferase [Thermobispora bispora]